MRRVVKVMAFVTSFLVSFQINASELKGKIMLNLRCAFTDDVIKLELYSNKEGKWIFQKKGTGLIYECNVRFVSFQDSPSALSPYVRWRVKPTQC